VTGQPLFAFPATPAGRPGAPTFAAHLTQIATALTTGSAVDDEVPYLTEHGAVHWYYPGQESTDAGERLFRAPTG
jgi:hypothetical protein